MGVTVLRLGQLPAGAGAYMPPRSIKAPAEATLGRHYGLKSIRSVFFSSFFSLKSVLSGS